MGVSGLPKALSTSELPVSAVVLELIAGDLQLVDAGDGSSSSKVRRSSSSV